MKKYNVLLLDDEDGNNKLLRHFIESYCPELNVVAECQTIQSVYREIIKYEVLIIFLDIELGNQENGFELMELINKRNDQIIIVSAFSNYAIQAFRYETTDFLMKPVKISELVEAVTRATKRMQQKSKVNTGEAMEQFPLQMYTKTQFVSPEAILFLEAEFTHTQIYMEDGSVFESSDRIGEFENRLDNGLFFRVHKSFIINTKQVNSILHEGAYSFVEMKNGAKIPIARRRKKLTYTRLEA